MSAVHLTDDEAEGWPLNRAAETRARCDPGNLRRRFACDVDGMQALGLVLLRIGSSGARTPASLAMAWWQFFGTCDPATLAEVIRRELGFESSDRLDLGGIDTLVAIAKAVSWCETGRDDFHDDDWRDGMALALAGAPIPAPEGDD